MPRSNHPRGRRGQDEEHAGLDLGKVLAGSKQLEHKRDGDWWVQPLSAANAQKAYRCPGCDHDIEPGVAHTVAWRSDGIMGEQNDLAGRRHWHLHCWRIKA